MDDLKDLKTIINAYFTGVSKLGIILVMLACLFLFTNAVTEFYDTAKFLVLLAVTGILLIFLTVKFTLNSKVVFVRTSLDIPLLLLLAVAVVSTVLSPAPYVALLGNQLKIHGSLVSLAVYIIFYFILTNSLRSVKEIKGILFIATIAGVILSILTLLAYFGVKLLPSPWIHGTNFTPTGSSFSTTAVLALLIPLVVSLLLSSTKPIVQVICACFLTLFGLSLALSGSLATWIAALLGLILTLTTQRRVLKQFVKQFSSFDNLRQIKPIRVVTLLSPAVLVLLVVVLSVVPPIGGAQNPLYIQAKNFPREIQLGFIPSWKISVSAFRDSPFWGTSPSTYLFDFTTYKPIEFNTSKNWNLRFEAAFNEYLQVLATLGIVGLVALLSLTALFIAAAYSVFVNRHSLVDERTMNHELRTSLAISGLLFFIILALHPSTLVLWVFGLIILASFMVVNLPVSPSSKPWTSLLQVDREETIRVDALPSILLTTALAVVLFAFYFGGKFALADYHHRVALNALAQNQGIVAYNELVAAEKLNPQSDLYRLDLAQTNFALANAIAQAKGATEASPSGSLTETDKQNIQVLLQQSITEGRMATTLNPRSALNWEILGLLYRQIAGVAQNALVFSLDAYGRAIAQDPLNPNLRLSVGGVYYAIKNYDLAIRFFTDAINLKPDFANGYYNLSVALKDKGDLVTAQAVAEKVLTLLQKDAQDYKVADAYLNDLKSKRESAVTPPAAETSGALQEEELPKVVDVGKPPAKIATPSAVKKPNATPEPSPTPTP